MKLQDVLPHMSKMYLNRTVGSFLKDVKIKDEDEMRQVILRNLTEFQNEERIKSNLDFTEDEPDIDVLNELILMCLVESDGYDTTYSQLLDDVEALETRVVSDGRDDQYISSAIPETNGGIYSAVLTAAWNKDESLNSHEKNILEVLRTQLKLTRHHHRLLESRIQRFPQRGNKLHGHQQIDDSLRDLQNKGLLVRYKTEDEYFLIPDEIARVVRYEIGGEVKTRGYELLLGNLRVDQLKEILTNWDLPSGGPKAALVERIVRFDILPSSALETLSSSDLSSILRSLSGAMVSGTKPQKILNIIDFYEETCMPITSDPTDGRAQYYDCFEELACRNYKTLRANELISKDLEIEHHFEEATRYLFEEKLGLQLTDMAGSKHADGRVKYNSKEVVLWDNKSTESPYAFPEEHIEQFLGYIRADKMRPTLFLVIVGEYTQEALGQAQKLKAYSQLDTDVAVITATDLKFVAEEWKSYSGKKKPQFDLEVFNLTGGLDRKTLIDRLSWILK